MIEACKYNPNGVDCNKCVGGKHECSTCGWNPKVSRARKAKIRADILKNNSHEVFVYGRKSF